MDPIALGLLFVGNTLLLAVFFYFFNRFKASILLHQKQSEERERELRRKVLELQVLRSLAERAGYSLDLPRILEVISDSLNGLIDYSTVSYIVKSPENEITIKIQLAEPVPRSFLNQVHAQMINSVSEIVGQKISSSMIAETISGSALDDRQDLAVESFFNIPVVIGGQVIALLNVSSYKKGLYGDEETTLLYTILNQVSDQISKLAAVIENQKRRLSAMISSLEDGVVMVDPQFNMIVSNRAVARMLRLEGNFYLPDIMKVVEGKIGLKATILHALSEQKGSKIPEVEIEGVFIQTDVEPVKDKLGNLLGVVVVFHNVSAEKELERMRESFTAMMVHELRTPLTTITYSTDMILSDITKMSPDKVADALNIVKSTTTNMLSLVNDLLDVAKIEAGKFEVVKVEDDLAKLIEEKVQLFKPQALQKKLELLTEISPGLPKLTFDHRRLGQALDNLISNALKYTDTGQVKVKLERIDGHVEVSVSDTGAGIASVDIDKLFSKFEQLGKGKSGEKKGTGLGLVVAKGIIEAHNGKIWAISEGDGRGATFSFSLPI